MKPEYCPQFEAYWRDKVLPVVWTEYGLPLNGAESLKPLFYQTWCAANTEAVLTMRKNARRGYLPFIVND